MLLYTSARCTRVQLVARLIEEEGDDVETVGAGNGHKR